MRALRRFMSRLAGLAAGSRREQRLAQEVDEHVALRTEDNIRAGMTPSEARRQALLTFGAVETIKEEYRDQRGLPPIETFAHDVRLGLRRLRKTPTFTAATVLTLALGIGATTAIFTLVHAVLLKSLPVSNPDQLYRLGKTNHCCVWGGYTQEGDFSIVSYELYQYFRDHTAGFAELAAFQADTTFLGVRRAHDNNVAETYMGEFVSGNYFTMFGLPAYAGRALSVSDDRPGAAPVAMMTYRVWEQKYGLDPSVIGAAFNIDDRPFTIVGITPPGFFGDTLRAKPPDFFLPIASEPMVSGANSILHLPDTHWLDVIGRVRPNVSVGAIQSQMGVELQQWLKSHSGELRGNERRDLPKQAVYIRPGGAGITSMRDQYQRWLEILMMVSGFVLLIVCANVANLLLVRGMERRQQTALSMALGARPARLVRQALTESVVLSLLGGVAGLAIAFAGTRLILHFAFSNRAALPISAAPSIPVLLFAFGVSLLSGIVFGITPAWLAVHADPVEALRGANRATAKTGAFSRRALVSLQTALSLALLCVAGLLTQALSNLEHQNFGFQQNGRVIVNIDPALAGYKPPQLEVLFKRIQESFANLPGVGAASIGLYTPMSGSAWTEAVYIEGQPEPGPDALNGGCWTRVMPGFFDVIGNPILKGRPITDRDKSSTQRVAVINEAFARRLFKNQDPLGKHFGKSDIRHATDYEVIGVAKDSRFLSQELDKPIVPFFFLPESQTSEYSQTVDESTEVRSHFLHDIIVRMQPGARLTEAMARHALESVDPNLPLMRMISLSDQVSRNFSQQRLIARLTSLFGILALVLASIGVYGVTAYNAGQRTNEIGVRMALGAGRGDVVALILRGAMLLVAIGLLLGAPMVLAGGRLLGSQLYGLNPYDPAILSAAILVLAVSGAIAAIIPALRASAISPIRALRSE